jgi:predicted dehydrogenase
LAYTELGTHSASVAGSRHPLFTRSPRKIETEAGSYLAYYSGVAESLRTGATPPVDPHDSVMGLRILETAIRSARSGTVERHD